jgi:hypothetical protein
MCTDGVVGSSDVALRILDREMVTEKELIIERNDTASEQAAAAIPQVPFIEHPEYGKFFRMVKAGIPAPAVKAILAQKGFDPNLLYNKPTDLTPLDLLPKKITGKVCVDQTPEELQWRGLSKSNVGQIASGLQMKMRRSSI